MLLAQYIILGFLFVGALYYLFTIARNRFSVKDDKGCGKGCGCGVKTSAVKNR